MKRIGGVILLMVVSILIGRTGALAALPEGFGKATWGMTKEQILSAYRISIDPPEIIRTEGVWAIEGPAAGELTVSGEALGEKDIRSVSFGIHPKLGLVIIHIRFKDKNSPSHVKSLIPKWTAQYGPPKEQLPGPTIIWEDQTTHIELTYHTVSPRHPTPSDHMAIVLWSIPLVDKTEHEKIELPQIPDVEKLDPMRQPHLEKAP